MLSRATILRSCLAAVGVAGCLIMTSCGTDDGLGKRYPVSGKVTYNGQPLEKGNISFVPEDAKDGIGASGLIENGTYALSVGGNNDGARAGKYKVVITAKEDTTEKAREAFEKARAKRKNTAGTEQIAAIPKEFRIKAEAAAKSLIPPGYGDIHTTTLKAAVEEKSNTFDFALSDAEAPPPPPDSTKGGGRRGR